MASHLAMRRVSGNLILESWNCFTLTRLVRAAGTVAVLMICRQGARTRCRDAISCRCRGDVDMCLLNMCRLLVRCKRLSGS